MNNSFLKTIRIGILLILILNFFNCNSDSDSNEETIYFGNVELRTQDEINEFGENNYTRIAGQLIINTSIQTVDTVIDLSPLNSIEIVDEQLGFYRLSNLSSVNFNVTEVGILGFELENAELINFPNLTKTTLGGIGIANNDKLTNFNFPSLSRVETALQIVNNPMLENLNGFSNLTSVGSEFENRISIQSNDLLLNFNGLENINSEISYLNLETNNSLQSLDGLNNLLLKDIEIILNPNLNDFCGISDFISIGESYDGNSYADGAAILYIDANSYNPNLEDFINGNCNL